MLLRVLPDWGKQSGRRLSSHRLKTRGRHCMRDRKLMAMTLMTAIASVSSAYGTSLEDTLLKLAPDERARQACVIKGLERLRLDKRLPKVDRIKTSILTPARLDGVVVTGTGAAVRSQGRWYVISFSCLVTKDLLKATSFEYQVGEEIPAERWDNLGLW